MVEIRRAVETVPPDVSVIGFWPPMTAMKPKGVVAARLTFPLNPFKLSTSIATVAVNPLTLTGVTVDVVEVPCIMVDEDGFTVSRKLPVGFCPKAPVRNGRMDALTVTVPMAAVRMTTIVRRGRSFFEKPNRPFPQQPLR